jgi:hypothetical protein
LLRAVVARPDPPVEGLVWLAGDGLGAWASPWEGPAEPTPGRLLEHHARVAAVHATADCLPVRFPTLVEDAGPLNARRDALLAALARVRGKTELALTLAWASPLPRLTQEEPQPRPRPGAALPGGAGTRYLRARRAYWRAREHREREARRLADQLRAELALPPDDVLVRAAPNEQIAVSLAALVPRDDAPAYRRVLAQPRSHLRVVVNGPWPPYSFATVE